MSTQTLTSDIRAVIEEWADALRNKDATRMLSHYAPNGDDVAFSHSLNRMHGTKTDGAKADLWFRQTFGFQRIKGEWKMAHEHESVPFYMDGSFKAAIDLKP